MKITSDLDKIANKLEQLGKTKLAHDIDIVSNTIEKSAILDFQEIYVPGSKVEFINDVFDYDTNRLLVKKGTPGVVSGMENPEHVKVLLDDGRFFYAYILDIKRNWEKGSNSVGNRVEASKDIYDQTGYKVLIPRGTAGVIEDLNDGSWIKVKFDDKQNPVGVHVSEICMEGHSARDIPKTAASGPMSEALKYHLDNGKGISDSEFRMGSDAWCDLVNECRDLTEKGTLKLASQDDRMILASDAGRRGIYKGKSVALDSPKRNPGGSKKKFYVYVNSGRKNKDGKVVAQKVPWGDPDLKIRNDDPEAAKSFRARHQCHLKKDKTTPGYWACNVGRYAKQLGLSSSRPW